LKTALAFKNSAHKLSSVTETKCEIRLGDCAEVLGEYPDSFFDLLVTSPPYADSRARSYGGIKPSQYVDWFLSRAKEFLRVLKPSGTFVLNVE
jgi:site-specific DNA-methyltransferase (adenine-specific)